MVEKKAENGQFAKIGPAICTIQPMAVCSIDERCSICPIAEKYLNPSIEVDIYQEMKRIKGCSQ